MNSSRQAEGREWSGWDGSGGEGRGGQGARLLRWTFTGLQGFHPAQHARGTGSRLVTTIVGLLEVPGRVIVRVMVIKLSATLQTAHT